MTGRKLRVSIDKTPDPTALVSVGRTSVRERLLSFLFGPLSDVAVIVPGHKVSDLTITPTTPAKQAHGDIPVAGDGLTPEERLIEAIFNTDDDEE